MNELQWRGERRMAGGRHAIDVDRDAPRGGDFGGDLRRRQHAAMPGLGALRQLDLDHLDLRIAGLGCKPLGAERAVIVAAAKIAAADLPDDVTAELLVVAAVAAFTSVVCKAAELGTLVERPDGVGAERAETHRRDIKERQRIGLPAIRAAD